MKKQRTIYVRHEGYIRQFIEQTVNNYGFIVKVLEEDSMPGKGDLVLYTDVSAYRGWLRFKQLIVARRNHAKIILLLYEPPVVIPYNYWRILHLPVQKIYTWNDEMIDNKRYFKWFWPQWSKDRMRKAIPFKKRKKLLAIFCSNKQPAIPFYPRSLYEKRVDTMRFFEKKIPKQFDIYGRWWDKPATFFERLFGAQGFKNWKGFVDDKIRRLATYKFCICYENLAGKKGYITEKILDAFKARCVPIYWGASNIDKYFPKEMFIDRRNFKNDQEVLSYIYAIKEQEYNKYILAIDMYMKSKKADVWFPDAVGKKMLKENT